MSRFPEITFRSIDVEVIKPNWVRAKGQLSLHGVTHPVALEAVFNGGYAGFSPYDPAARIGFSGHTMLSRSDFGIMTGLPPEGSSMGVGDNVEVIIEAEFIGPPLEE